MDPETMSVKALKAELVGLGLRALAMQAVEKSDLVEQLRLARARGAAAAPRGTAAAPRAAPPQSTPVGAAAAAPAAAEVPTDEEVERVIACPGGNFYQILGVPCTADAALLKKAYRRLALRLHPDKNPASNADEAFKRVSAAFACLRDRTQRTMYDLQGGDTGRHDPPGGSGGGGGGGYSSSGGSGGGARGGFGRDVDAEELYRAFFGGGEGDAGEGSEAVAGLGGAVGSAVALGGRLLSAFWKNPWTLITLLSALASLVSVVETISETLHVSGWQAALALPALVLFAFAFVFAGKQR